jgi:hypothetical protein
MTRAPHGLDYFFDFSNDCFVVFERNDIGTDCFGFFYNFSTDCFVVFESNDIGTYCVGFFYNFIISLKNKIYNFDNVCYKFCFFKSKVKNYF